jgi:hypothetical protein
MINFIYIILCIGCFAYTGKGIITFDRAMAISFIGCIEFVVELFIALIVVENRGSNR